MATTFFTSDLHFGHRNIIEYCNRPFSSVDDMNAGLVSRWNDVVGDDDEVWVLGDVCMGKIDESLGLVKRLAGHKRLLVGNHDRMFAGKDPSVWRGRYYREAGFEEILEGEHTIKIGGKDVVMCHFPYVGDSRGSDRFTEYRPTDQGKFLLHGHVHDRWRQEGRMINVGVDAWAGAPVSLSCVEELIASGPNSLECLPWEANTG